MQKLRKYEFDDTNAIGDLNIKFLGYNPFIFTIPWDRSNTLTLSLPISLANHLIFFSFLLKYNYGAKAAKPKPWQNKLMMILISPRLCGQLLFVR